MSLHGCREILGVIELETCVVAHALGFKVVVNVAG